MFSIEDQEKISQLFADKFRKIENEYLEMVAEHLVDIGKLNPSDIKRLEQITIMNGNVKNINQKLANLTKSSIKEVEETLIEYAQEQYGDSAKFYKSAGIAQVTFSQNEQLKKIINAVAETTAKTMANLSNTTIISQTYKQAVDEAILVATSGVADYQSSMKKVIREQSALGIRAVEYASGNKRRLDTAVRLNVMEGIHQVNLGVAEQTGKEFGADGVEITSHSNPAPDHKYIDGKIMTNAEFEKFQQSAKRPIGKLNCYHFAIPILLDISTPILTNKEREKKRKEEDKKFEFGGQSLTKYEWTQEQRKLETAMRYQKDVLRMSEKGFKNLNSEAKNEYKRLKSAYDKMNKSLGLESHMDRVF